MGIGRRITAVGWRYPLLGGITVRSLLAILVCVLLPLTASAHDTRPSAVTLNAALVLTLERGRLSRPGRALVSNGNHYMTLLHFGTIPPGKWNAELCVTCTGPVGRAPLAIQIRALDTGWHAGITYAQLTSEAGWYVSWSDGEQIIIEIRADEPVLNLPRVYCVRLGAHHDYWQQIHNWGLVLMAESGQTAGVTYSLRGDLVRLHLRRV